MLRHGLMLSLLGCAGLLAGMEFAAAQTPACLYGSKSYSDGALVCVQKSLMLKCTSDVTGMSWKPVTDSDLSGRCSAPTAAVYSPAPGYSARRHFHARHALLHRHEPAHEVAAKCFNFNGRQYCE